MQANYLYEATNISTELTELSLEYSCVDISVYEEGAESVVDGNERCYVAYEYACCAHHEEQLS